MTCLHKAEETMSRALQLVSAFGLASLLVAPAIGATIYNNLTPNNLIAVATRPDTAPFEIEAGDDFFLGSETRITGASFDGLLVPGASGALPTISQVLVEIYRVFSRRFKRSSNQRPPNILDTTGPDPS